MTDRIGKKGALYNTMQKRFINLGKTEFAAKNKLVRELYIRNYKDGE